MRSTRTVIKPQRSLSVHLGELWAYRELFYFFTWRDIKVKYKQTYLGVAWAVLQPLALMVLFTLVFSRQLATASVGMDYKTFILSGLVLWTLFYSATSHAAESIIQQSGIIKKIYFPRFIIIGSALLTALFDFFIALGIFFLFCLFIGQPIRWQALFLFPAGIGLVLFSAFGLGSLLAALNVKYRDFRYALPFLLQLLFFSSQVVFSLQSIKQPVAKMLLSLNPVNAAIEAFRAGLTGRADGNVIAIGTGTAFFFCLAGFFYFRKTEDYFADLA